MAEMNNKEDILYIQLESWVRTHDILKLFGQLSISNKQNITSLFDNLLAQNKPAYVSMNKYLSSSSVKEGLRVQHSHDIGFSLSCINATFVNWRYSFERKKHNSGIFYYSELLWALDETFKQNFISYKNGINQSLKKEPL
jgi:hypothetical protein